MARLTSGDLAGAERLSAEFVFANDVIANLRDYKRVNVPDQPSTLHDFDHVRSVVRRANAGGGLEGADKTIAGDFCEWRLEVSRRESETAKRIEALLFALRCLESLVAINPSDDVLPKLATQLSAFLRGVHHVETPPVPDAQEARKVAQLASRRLDVMGKEWRAL